MTLGSNVSNVWSYFNESKKRKHEVMNGLAEDSSDPKPNHSNQPSFPRSDSGIPAKRPRVDNQAMPVDDPINNTWFNKVKKTLNSAWDALQGRRANADSADSASTSNEDNSVNVAPSGSSFEHQSSIRSNSDVSQPDMSQHFDPMTNYSTQFQAEGSVVKKKKKYKLLSSFDKKKYKELLNRHLSIPAMMSKITSKPMKKPSTEPIVIDLTEERQQSLRSPAAHPSQPNPISEHRFTTDIMDKKSGISLINRIRENNIGPAVVSSSQSTPKLWSFASNKRNHSIPTQSWSKISNFNTPLKTSQLSESLHSKNSAAPKTPTRSPTNETYHLSSTLSATSRTTSLPTLPESCFKFNNEAKERKELLDPTLIFELKSKSNQDYTKIEHKFSKCEISLSGYRNKRQTDIENLSPKIWEPINRRELQPFGAFIPYIETDDKDEDDYDEEEGEGPSQFLEFTPEMNKLIDAALVPTPPNEVLSEGSTGQICRKDMETLKGLNWLNDEIINFYLSLIVERGKNDNFSSVYAFNTFFYKKLRDSGPQSLKRWTRRVDVFANDFIFIPIHLGMHWCLAVINFVNKKIEYYDSMGGKNLECVNALKDWLMAESLDKKKVQFPMTDWVLEMVKDIPQQMNGSDCGMFTCKYAEYISRKAKINFSQAHMPYFRRRMVYEILTKQLL